MAFLLHKVKKSSLSWTRRFGLTFALVFGVFIASSIAESKPDTVCLAKRWRERSGHPVATGRPADSTAKYPSSKRDRADPNVGWN